MSKGTLESANRRSRTRNQQPQGQNNEGGDNIGIPLLIIPYYLNEAPIDKNTRNNPFPSGIISYWCNAIKINKIVYTGEKLPRNVSAEITVDVLNWGSKPAEAYVSFYWAELTAGFTVADLVYIGDAPRLHVPAGNGTTVHGAATTLPVGFVPNDSMAEHVCLFAEVTSADDPASGGFDPVMDPHYAQHNIFIAHIDDNMTRAFTFYVGNPFDTDADLRVSARLASREELRTLESVYQSKAAELPDSVLALRAVADRTEGGAGRQQEMHIRLRAGERRLLQGMITPTNLAPDQFGALEVETIATPLEGQVSTERRGSLGVVVFPNSRGHIR